MRRIFAREATGFAEESRLFAGGDSRTAYFFDLWYAAPVVERTYDELSGQG